jgi:hypothetical protein
MERNVYMGLWIGFALHGVCHGKNLQADRQAKRRYFVQRSKRRLWVYFFSDCTASGLPKWESHFFCIHCTFSKYHLHYRLQPLPLLPSLLDHFAELGTSPGPTTCHLAPPSRSRRSRQTSETAAFAHHGLSSPEAARVSDVTTSSLPQHSQPKYSLCTGDR